MSEEDVAAILRHPLAMIETDGDNVSYGVGFPHPRSYGAFPRVLGRYVREQKLLSLQEAVLRMNSLAAEQVGQHERGKIAEGSIWSSSTPKPFGTAATYTNPHRYAVGVHHLVISGKYRHAACAKAFGWARPSASSSPPGAKREGHFPHAGRAERASGLAVLPGQEDWEEGRAT